MNKYLLNGICVSSCTEKTYLDTTLLTCLPCNISCYTCAGNANTCTSCPNQKSTTAIATTYLINELCVINCPNCK